MAGKPEKKRPIKQSVRFQVFKRDEFTCTYCGRKSPEVELEADHKIPRSKGGTDDPENLVTSCTDCNRGKGSQKLSGPASATQSQVAKALGIDRRVLVDWIDGGHIIRMERGQYDIIDVAAQAIKYLRGRSSADALTEKKTELATEQARKIRMDNSEREGQTLNKVHTQNAFVSFWTAVRIRYVAVAARVAARFHSKMTQAQVQALVLDEINNALKSVSSAEFKFSDTD